MQQSLQTLACKMFMAPEDQFRLTGWTYRSWCSTVSPGGTVQSLIQRSRRRRAELTLREISATTATTATRNGQKMLGLDQRKKDIKGIYCKMSLLYTLFHLISPMKMEGKEKTQLDFNPKND